jgi:hypothetical protein
MRAKLFLSASLEAIAIANGKPTGDELRKEIINQQKIALNYNPTTSLTNKQYRKYVKIMKGIDND